MPHRASCFVLISVLAFTNCSATHPAPATATVNLLSCAMAAPVGNSDFNADKESLQSVLARLNKQTSDSVKVNMDAIKKAGVSMDTPVTVHIKRATVSAVLKAALKQSDKQALGYSINSWDDFLVTTRSDLFANHVYTRQYNLRDILHEWRFEHDAKSADVREREAAFVNLIKETVDPNSWEMPGSKCSLQVSEGIVTATQTFENLRDLENLFDQLRETRSSPVEPPINASRRW